MRFLRKNVKFLLGLMTGILLSSGVLVYATTYVANNRLNFNNYEINQD